MCVHNGDEAVDLASVDGVLEHRSDPELARQLMRDRQTDRLLRVHATHSGGLAGSMTTASLDLSSMSR